MAQPRITIIGAGMSGAACANAVRQAGFPATVLDRARTPGGRMASPSMDARRVDIGAAYFTVADPAFEAVVRRWESAGQVRPWTDRFDVWAPASGLAPGKAGPPRWSAPGGLRSLVADLLAEEDVRTEAAVAGVGHDGAGPTVDAASVDFAVLAMPDPQAGRLFQDAAEPSDDPLAEARSALEQVGYSAVLAVTARWSERSWPFRDGVFVNDHPLLSFVADDGARRGDGAPVLVSHTGEQAAESFLQRPEQAIEPVVAALQDLFGTAAPDGPRAAHRWTYAKPTGTHGHAPFLLTESGIGLAGDSWCPKGSPRVESAWLSGAALGAAIAERLAQ